ncbi:transcriptional regulator [Bradyrhizobium sp. CCBAU 51745]|nr:adenylate/guanylate cyclase domain-containing protein [Bradyrhizobium sp. CCBAU 51745]MDA9405317.1 transcriptional regulator [Bradyrhizobium sp. CCBAU 45384]MDA9440010.1 transcriptional regulator [Bradyrhizobium sp. CCBAU 51745]
MSEESHTARRLAAILAADVVGYSRLMGADEEGTLAALKGHRKELIDPLIAQHQGRIVKTTGDGLLIEFASIVDAVRFAVVMQQGMKDRNANLDDSHCIRFRVGINVGDVIVEDGDIFGDGVNVAARLETLAEPGEICVSATVREHVGEKLPIGFADLGEHSVKNIARPVHVYRIETRSEPKTASSGNAASSGNPGPAMLALPDRPSIAVLPFANMSGDAEQDYFCDGMVEDIITGLSRLKWMFVIARNSSFVYKGKSVDVKQVGRDLGVRYVLEGSVRKASNRVRVTGQVVEAETGRHVWAERYDRTLDDIFALQDELTTSVVAAIEPSLRQAEVERVKRKRPDNLDAYDLLLRAIPDVYPAMPGRAAKALPLLESALNLEPDYAAAHGFAAWCHEILFVRGGAHEENRLGAASHAHAAIANGRDDATALALGGFALGLVAHDREAASRAFEVALALSPSCSLAYGFGSVVMATGGDADRGIEWGEQALRLSPFDPMSFGPLFAIAFGHFQRAEYEGAAEAARRCFQANPNWSYAHMLLAATHAKLGRVDAARAAAARVLELEPGYTISGMRAAAGFHPSIAEPLAEALRVAGLPE